MEKICQGSATTLVRGRQRTIPFTLNAAYEKDTRKETVVVFPLVAQYSSKTPIEPRVIVCR